MTVTTPPGLSGLPDQTKTQSSSKRGDAARSQPSFKYFETEPKVKVKPGEVLNFSHFDPLWDGKTRTAVKADEADEALIEFIIWAQKESPVFDDKILVRNDLHHIHNLVSILDKPHSLMRPLGESD
jgi:hypothetical protein